MATDPNATPADADDQPQAGTTSQADTPDTDGAEPEGTGQPTETISIEEARKLRSEANSLRKRLKTFEEEAKKRADAEKSEAEKLAERAAELDRREAEFTARQKARNTADAVEAAAKRLGFKYPGKALRLLDTEALEIDEDGNPTKADEALRALLAEMPELAATGNGSPTNPARGGGTSTLTMEKLRSMSAAEIAKYPKADVDAVLQGARS